MDPLPNHPVADLGWSQVGFGLTFIAFNSIISQALQLHVGASLVFAALRCVVQLTLVATVLQRVFAAENFWAVVGIACECIVVCLAGIFTTKFDSPSIAEFTWHDRNWCVRYLITIHFSLADPRVPLAKQVVIKSGRRCENMVCDHYCMFLLKGNEFFCQVWRRANRDVGLDDTGVYLRGTICDAGLPVLDTGTIQ